MKIRSGFVSNSSSASFMITADITLENFCNEFYSDFNREALQKRIQKRIDENNFEVEKLRTTKDKFHIGMRKIWISQLQGQIKLDDQMLKKIPTMTLTEVVMSYFSFDGYTLYGQDEKTRIDGWICMYNEESDFGKLFLDTEKALKKKKIYFTREVQNDH